MALVITELCAALNVNKEKSGQAAIGLEPAAKPPAECAMEWKRASYSSLVLATMLNDAGGPCPCDKVPIGDSKADVFDFIEK
jgi:hypothetical protein